MSKKVQLQYIIIIVLIIVFACSCGMDNQKELVRTPDLIIYTTLDKDIYQPIIREYENRKHVDVEVRETTEEDVVTKLFMNKDEYEGDAILGLTRQLIDNNQQLFPEKVAFASSVMVIAYNNNIVMRKDKPKNFQSLLEPCWKDRIGFAKPEDVATYQGVLQYAIDEYSNQDSHYLDRFYKNIGKNYAQSMEEVAEGVCDGKYSVGVVTEEKAKEMKEKYKDIEYIYLGKRDCVITEFSTTTLNRTHEQLAKDFVEFTTSNDVQRYLSEYFGYGNNDKGDE